jgi:hypothetical protein
MPLDTAEEVAISHHGSELEIVRRWFNRRTIALTVFVAVLNAMLTFALSKTGAFDAGPLAFFDLSGLVDSPARLLQFGVLIAVIYYTYKVVADWLNRTRIVVSRETLSVRHSPVPWPGVGPLTVADIRQFHAIEARSYSGGGKHQRTTITFEVHAERQDGRSIKLLDGFESSSQAIRVAQEIAKYSGKEIEQGAPNFIPRKPAGVSSGWKVVIALLVIAAGIAAILTFGMLRHSDQDALRRQLVPPPTWHK